MCRAGSYNLAFESSSHPLYQKPHRVSSNKTLMQEWDPDYPKSIVFDEYSLAYALWNRLFIGTEASMSKESDFALTAAAGIIKAQVPEKSNSFGFFTIQDPFHESHTNALLNTKYITLATPSSSKLELRTSKTKYKFI